MGKEMSNVPDYFGSMVFDDRVMRERLPKETYRTLRKTIDEGRHLDLTVANVVANAMKDWACERGATHFTHWFQPMTGITAEKHDSFISPCGNGNIIMEFSGKELVRGEPDASSFPSGGLRATFEARGYTAWDATSYAFIKDKVLCIPTAFCSYGGEALDKKTPLLRSMEALEREAKKLLKILGNDTVKRVRPTVGPEQEYFLVDRDMFDRRHDLIYTGRTLFGAKPPKGQELDDHYFGTIKSRVKEFMDELNTELWKLGVLIKTEHNEVAPAQHELAPIFTTTNISCDHNQITMELMQRIAKRHGLVCLLHEKPFKGVNGSGKHNNWSLCTDDGTNLLEPGDTPHENAQFLLFICAVIRAVDDYQDLLRISVATAGNDHRLGANEAPPAVVSMFLGDELTEILDSIENDVSYNARENTPIKVGVHTLPRIPKDTTDRNRTSPFAFTGNKFEFRMLGSSASIAGTNVVLNTAVAESLRAYSEKLEGAEDKAAAMHDLISSEIKAHKRIIFNGNGYDGSWLKEATEARGLLNLRTTPDALPYWMHEKNVELFTRHKVYSREEMRSRYEIMLENYSKIITIEASTMCDMARHEILPAVTEYSKMLAEAINSKTSVAGYSSNGYETEVLSRLSDLSSEIWKFTKELEDLMIQLKSDESSLLCAEDCRDRVIPVMEKLRDAADEAEALVGSGYWPFPTYGDLLFGVR